MSIRSNRKSSEKKNANTGGYLLFKYGNESIVAYYHYKEFALFRSILFLIHIVTIKNRSFDLIILLIVLLIEIKLSQWRANSGSSNNDLDCLIIYNLI